MNPHIITITGKARHGKTTFAEYLKQELEPVIPARIDKFSRGVKEKARQLGWDGEKDNNGRVLLQFIGTEWGRQCIDEDIWAQDAADRISPNDQVVIVDDARFKNEIEYFSGPGYELYPVKVIRIEPDDTIWDNGLGDLSNHASEQDLPDELFAKGIRHCFKKRLEVEAENVAVDILSIIREEVE